MTLQDVASVSGKPGLYKVLRPTRTGVVLEAINEKKSKLIAGANSRVSILKEISIYTTGAESSVLLEVVYKDIFKKYSKALPVTAKSGEAELFGFLAEILPNYDVDRVYHSDIKKMISWYNLLVANLPEIFEELVKEDEPKEEKKTTVKKKTEEKPKKAAAKKETKSTAKSSTTKKAAPKKASAKTKKEEPK